MRRGLLALILPAVVLLAAVTTPRVASAQDLPSWRIAEMCAGDSAAGQCQLFEARAQNAVTGGWAVLPEAYRKACIAAVKGPQDRSWRGLSECLETQVLAGLGKRAIMTADTPDTAAAIAAPPTVPPMPSAPSPGPAPADAIAQPPREAAPSVVTGPPPPFTLPSTPPQ